MLYKLRALTTSRFVDNFFHSCSQPHSPTDEAGLPISPKCLSAGGLMLSALRLQSTNCYQGFKPTTVLPPPSNFTAVGGVGSEKTCSSDSHSAFTVARLASAWHTLPLYGSHWLGYHETVGGVNAVKQYYYKYFLYLLTLFYRLGVASVGRSVSGLFLCKLLC